MFRRNPQEIYEEWDDLWIERINIVIEARGLAAIDPTKKPLEGN